MAIEFNNVTYIKNHNMPNQHKILNKLSFNIETETINAICGDDSIEIIGKLLCALELPTIGSIYYNNFDIKPNSYIRNINKLRKEVGYIYYNPKDYFLCNTVEKEIKYGLIKHKYRIDKALERSIEALKILGLNEEYLNLNPKELSSSEQKKVMIASVIALNPKVLIFNRIETNLCYRDQMNLIRLIKTLNKKYNKTIIMINSNINFLLSFVNHYYFIDNGKLSLSCGKDDLFNENNNLKFNYSPIIELTKYARNNNSKLDNYYEVNEFIKGVYRDVR